MGDNCLKNAIAAGLTAELTAESTANLAAPLPVRRDVGRFSSPRPPDQAE
jgi:hypothetical protein